MTVLPLLPSLYCPLRRYPLSYCISLAVQPTALIGVDASLRAPKAFQVRACCAEAGALLPLLGWVSVR